MAGVITELAANAINWARESIHAAPAFLAMALLGDGWQPMLLPREHGMYGQVALPLITSMMVAGVNEGSVLLTVAVVSAFMTHEPLLVLLGRRGLPAKIRTRREACVSFAIGSTVTVVTGLLAVWWSAPDIRWAFWLPLVPATFTLTAISVGREKTLSGELAAALTLALVALPLGLAAGLRPMSPWR